MSRFRVLIYERLFFISSHCYWGQAYCENMLYNRMKVGSYLYNVIVSNYVIRTFRGLRLSQNNIMNKNYV
jgi:hypothetical protein